MDAKQRVIIMGGLIGAVLGAGVAYLLKVAPTGLAEDDQPEPVTAKELIGLTGAAAVLVRGLDDLRRKL